MHEYAPAEEVDLRMYYALGLCLWTGGFIHRIPVFEKTGILELNSSLTAVHINILQEVNQKDG